MLSRSGWGRRRAEASSPTHRPARGSGRDGLRRAACRTRTRHGHLAPGTAPTHRRWWSPARTRWSVARARCAAAVDSRSTERRRALLRWIIRGDGASGRVGPPMSGGDAVRQVTASPNAAAAPARSGQGASWSMVAMAAMATSSTTRAARAAVRTDAESARSMSTPAARPSSSNGSQAAAGSREVEHVGAREADGEQGEDGEQDSVGEVRRCDGATVPRRMAQGGLHGLWVGRLRGHGVSRRLYRGMFAKNSLRKVTLQHDGAQPLGAIPSVSRGLRGDEGLRPPAAHGHVPAAHRPRFGHCDDPGPAARREHRSDQLPPATAGTTTVSSRRMPSGAPVVSAGGRRRGSPWTTPRRWRRRAGDAAGGHHVPPHPARQRTAALREWYARGAPSAEWIAASVDSTATVAMTAVNGSRWPWSSRPWPTARHSRQGAGEG